jgi:hypothetical protein
MILGLCHEVNHVFLYPPKARLKKEWPVSIIKQVWDALIRVGGAIRHPFFFILMV